MWILELLNTVVKRRRFIIINTLIVTLVAATISFVVPREYKSRTTILPPEAQAGFSGLGDLSMAQVARAVTSFSLPMMASPSDLYASMLKSDVILKKVVDSLDLETIYEASSEWQAVTTLRDRLMVRVESDGIITVEAISRDSELAARIANLLALELNELNLQLESKRGGQQVDFLSGRLLETEEELQDALTELREFQEQHKAISLEMQSAVLIENLARQKANLTAAEIELNMLRKSLRPDHPSLIRQQLMVQEIGNKLVEIEHGGGTRADSVLSALDIPLDDIPELGLRFSVLKRNVRIQELIYEVLAQQLEMSRIQEKRDTPVISVLDFARPAGQPFRPRKVLITVTAFLISLMASILLVVAYERLRENRSLSDLIATQMKETLVEVKRKPLG
jgi:uncharacterized protein involved in exopolysaccharide biosynthesis